jgi:uncharacterized membrane protein (DUF441 family)
MQSRNDYYSSNKLKSEEGLFMVNLTMLSLLAKNKSERVRMAVVVA